MTLRNLLRADVRAFEEHYGRGLLPKLYHPMFTAVLMLRLAQAAHSMKLLPVAYLLVRLNDLLHGIWVGPKVQIGPGLCLAHARGLVVNPDTRIGANCVILQQVTLGGPGIVVGDGVMIGAGAKIISRRHKGGGLTIGNGARIGAGAVVLRDVAPGSTVVGPEATVISAPPKGDQYVDVDG